MGKTRPKGEVVVYQGQDGALRIEAKMVGETIWLPMFDIAKLFGVKVPAISKHIKNIYATRELSPRPTISKMETVRREGKRQVTRTVEHYSLDMIISIGYRVNSAKATKFRIWATQTLNEHLTRGYTLNRQRFEQNARELQTALQLVRKAAAGEALTTDQGRGLVDIIARYTQTFLLLQRYDEGLLTEPKGIAGGARRVRCSDRNAMVGSNPFSATWNKACSADQPIPALNRKPRIFCISSLRIIRSPTVTSASGRSCSSIS